jgi:ABC-type multidrug transport system permease subunit
MTRLARGANIGLRAASGSAGAAELDFSPKSEAKAAAPRHKPLRPKKYRRLSPGAGSRSAGIVIGPLSVVLFIFFFVFFYLLCALWDLLFNLFVISLISPG